MRVKNLGLCEYRPAWEAMRRHTAARIAGSEDEIWLAEHFPVFTLGAGGDASHLLRRGAVPIVKSDRGGQITYHAPGQAVAYVLLDLRRRRLTVRELVTNLERAVVALLADYDINAAGGALARAALRRAGQTPPTGEARFSPGVYAGEKKIAALGLRVSRGFCYHGVALNVRMDLRPFADINPCGFAGLAAAQMADFGVAQTAAQVSPQLAAKLIEIFNKDNDGKPPPDALR